MIDEHTGAFTAPAWAAIVSCPPLPVGSHRQLTLLVVTHILTGVKGGALPAWPQTAEVVAEATRRIALLSAS